MILKVLRKTLTNNAMYILFIFVLCVAGCARTSESLLFWASRLGFSSGVRVLLVFGADPNTSDEFGHTPLYEAALTNRLGIAKLLIDKGAKANLADEGHSPLHAAALLNNIEMAEFLIQSGADINAQSLLGSPLEQASRGGHIKMIELLLENGADVNGRGTRTKMSPLSAAASSGHSEALLFLLKSGADINDPLSVGLASYGGHKKVVQMLIEKGCPITRALLHVAFDDRVEIAELLIEKGADVNEKSERGRTPLHRAAFYGAEGVIGVLIANGADVSIEDNDGLKPFELAMDVGHGEVAETLRPPNKPK